MEKFLESVISRDPAAKSKISVILTYPGVKAVFFHHPILYEVYWRVSPRKVRLKRTMKRTTD